MATDREILERIRNEALTVATGNDVERIDTAVEVLNITDECLDHDS